MIRYLFPAIVLFICCTFAEAQKVEKRKYGLKLMKEYSPESYALIKKVEDLKNDKLKGVVIFGASDFSKWISSNKAEQVLEDIGTAVHETCHAYAFRHPLALHGGFGEEGSSFYIDEHTTIFVPHTKVFNSHKMADDIPRDLRTHRYRVYLSGKSMLSAQKDGVYGLMNEWTAYFNGSRMNIQLFDEYARRAEKEGVPVFLDYLSNVNSTLLAHYEFKYFILFYLKYAQRNYPEVYREILSNDPFVEAFNLIHAGFEGLVRQHEANKQTIKLKAEQEGLKTREDQQYFYIGNRGVGNFTEDYDKLKLELLKKSYSNLASHLLIASLP